MSRMLLRRYNLHHKINGLISYSTLNEKKILCEFGKINLININNIVNSDVVLVSGNVNNGKKSSLIYSIKNELISKNNEIAVNNEYNNKEKFLILSPDDNSSYHIKGLIDDQVIHPSMNEGNEIINKKSLEINNIYERKVWKRQKMIELLQPKYDIYSMDSFINTILTEYGNKVGLYQYLPKGDLNWNNQAYLLSNNINRFQNIIKELSLPKKDEISVRILLSYFRRLEEIEISLNDYKLYLDKLNDGINNLNFNKDTIKILSDLYKVEKQKYNAYKEFNNIKNKDEKYSKNDRIGFFNNLLNEHLDVKRSIVKSYSKVIVNDIQNLSPLGFDTLKLLMDEAKEINHPLSLVCYGDPYNTSSDFSKFYESIGLVTNGMESLLNQFPETQIVIINPNKENNNSNNSIIEYSNIFLSKSKFDSHFVNNSKAYEIMYSDYNQHYNMNEYALNLFNNDYTNENFGKGGKSSFYSYPTMNREIQGLAYMIENMNQYTKQSKGLNTIAIFVPSWNDVDIVVAGLKSYNINSFVYFSSRSRILSVELSKLYLDLFTFLLDPQHTSLELYHILSSKNGFNISHQLLSKINNQHQNSIFNEKIIEYKNKKKRDEINRKDLIKLKGNVRKKPLFELLQELLNDSILLNTDKNDKNILSFDEIKELKYVIHTLNDLITKKDRVDTRKILLEFIEKTDNLNKLYDPQDEEEFENAEIAGQFINFLTLVEKDMNTGLIGFLLPKLRSIQEYGMDKYINETDRLFNLEDDNCVHIIPLNMSNKIKKKYSVGFFPFSTEQRLSTNFNSFKLPVDSLLVYNKMDKINSTNRMDELLEQDNFINQLNKVKYYNELSNEMDIRKSLYHAISKCNEQIVFSCSEWQDVKKRSPFIYLAGGINLKEYKVDKSINSKFAFHWNHNKPKYKKNADYHLPFQFYSSDPLILSYSAISSYSFCGWRFFLQYILGIRSSTTPLLIYGDAMHTSIETGIFKLNQKLSNHIDNKKEILNEIENEMIDIYNDKIKKIETLKDQNWNEIEELVGDGIIGLKDFLLRYSTGLEAESDEIYPWISSDLYNKNKSQLVRRPKYLEKRFLVELPEFNIVINGIFDRIDTISLNPTDNLNYNNIIYDKEILREDTNLDQNKTPSHVIVEYKSHMNKNKNLTELVKHHQQLQLYSLVHQKIFGTLPIKVVLESVEDGRKGELMPDRDYINQALEFIGTNVEGIKKGNFEPKPEQWKCYYCPFSDQCNYSVKTDHWNQRTFSR